MVEDSQEISGNGDTSAPSATILSVYLLSLSYSVIYLFYSSTPTGLGIGGRVHFWTVVMTAVSGSFLLKKRTIADSGLLFLVRTGVILAITYLVLFAILVFLWAQYGIIR